MRTIFIKTLVELAEKDKNIYFLTGDLGYSVLEDFIEKFPERFINCGVAEQNMMGVAAGLALSGKKPYVYSIIPFVTMRCFEQVRNDVCYQKLDVKIVGIGGGVTYGNLGVTHYAIEDLAILRALPNMTVLCPADPIETKELVLKSYQTKNPTYIRLNKKGEETLYDFNPNIIIGKPSILKNGKDGAIITTGVLLKVGRDVVNKLEKFGYNFKLISIHTLKPIDKKILLEEIKDKKIIFTLEEHSVVGGLGAAVAEILAESDYLGFFKIIGIPDEYSLEIGDTKYLHQKYGFVPEEIVNQILKYKEKIKKI
ncbi:MAG: 1-deoxy-D-xylulose-5-phosphate synthase [Candidatus Nealsonbacteria bacterium]|nr:1-deoxy-D-xylulose-5-phosphate synthase [Candidatus Nealsonbacteria bacterium]